MPPKPTRGRSRSHRWVKVLCPVYGVAVYAFYGAKDKHVDTLKAVLPPDLWALCKDAVEDGGQGLCVRRQRTPYRPDEAVSVVLYADTEDVLTHEVLHAVNMILSYAGVNGDLDNDEAQVYYTCWLMREIRKGVGL